MIFSCKTGITIKHLALATWMCAQANANASDALDFWQWRTPLPSGATRGQIGFLNGEFIVVTSGPGLLVSGDGTNWTSRLLPFEGGASQITYGNGRYVVAGSDTNGGMVASSTNLIDWQRFPAGTPWSLFSVTYGAGRFVAAGRSSNFNVHVVTSGDGTNWTPQSIATPADSADVVFGNGLFLLAPGVLNSTVLVSADGDNWTPQSVPNGGAVTWLSAGGGKFFAAGYRYPGGPVPVPSLAVSTNGVDWTPIATPVPSQEEFRAVLGNGYYLGVSPNIFSDGLSRSPDGNGFTNFIASGFLPTRRVTYANDIFVSGNLQTSPDGTNWNPTAVSPTNTSLTLNDIAAGAEVIVALGDTLMVSTNGLRFVASPAALPAPATRIKYAAGLFHAVGNGGALLRSTNGLDWVTRNSATGANLYDLDFGGGQWVAVGASGTITASATGNAWSLRTSGSIRSLRGIAYGTNMFTVVGDQGTVLTSPDGVTWTSQFADTTNDLRSVIFGQGQFLAVGDNGTVLSSTNGSDWEARSVGTSAHLESITFGDGIFCASTSDKAFTSANGISWQQRRIGAAVNNVRFLNGTFFGVGGINILQSGPVAPVRLNLTWRGGGPDVSVEASPGLLLRLQTAAGLIGSPWLDWDLLTNSPAGTNTISDPSSVGLSQRYYRAVAP